MKQEQTLGTYESSTFGKELFIAPAKGTKTTTLIGNILGVMPWQENGGIVDKPSSLHIISFDASAIGGVYNFLTNECGAGKEITSVHIENLQDAARKAFASRTEYDPTFLNVLYEAIKKCQDRAVGKGVHAIMFASFTMCAKAILRSISGPALVSAGAQMKKNPMDQNKWTFMKQIMTELQWMVQQDNYHTIWEGHQGEKITKETDGTGTPKVLDTIQVDGGTAKTFPAQVERVWEIVRSPMKWEKTKVALTHFNPNPQFDFGEVQTGRGVTGVLESKEPCLTLAFHKLGLKIGGYGT